MDTPNWWSIAIVMAVVILVATAISGPETDARQNWPEAGPWPAREQAAPQDPGSPRLGPTPAGMMMPERCEVMERQMGRMHARLRQMDSNLDGLVAKMKSAKGEAKIAAMEAVITEMVASRERMRETQDQMHMDMMSHMMAHVTQNAETEQDRMIDCPLLKDLSTEGASRPGSINN